MAWTPPAIPVFVTDPKRELRTAIETLTPPAVTPKHAVWCLSKLMLAFGSKLDAESAKLQGAVWIEACGDLGDELWSKATMALIRGWRRDDHFGRLPEPADFREAVATDLAERGKKIARCKALLHGLGGGEPAKPGPFVPEPPLVRLRSMRDSYRKHGYTDRAAKCERELAEAEGRAVEDWALAAGVPTSAGNAQVAPPSRPLSPAMQAATRAAVAEQHRAAGRHAYADRLEESVRDLGYGREAEPELEPVDEYAEAV